MLYARRWPARGGCSLLALLLLLACDRDETEPGCVDDATQFERSVEPVLQSTCIACHVDGGTAGHTRHVLVPESEAGHAEANRQMLLPLALEQVDGRSLLLRKVSGELGHGGGVLLSPDDPDYGALEELVARAHLPGGCSHPGAVESCEPGKIAAGPTPLRRLTSTQYANAVEDLLGVRPADGLFPPTERDERTSTWAEANLVSSAGVEGILLAAEAGAAAVEADLGAATGCTPTDGSCARAWTDAFVRRAFRRNPTAEETALVDLLWAAGGTPQEQVGLVVEFALQSPQFLYLDGHGSAVADADGVEQLTPHAVAARLSFFLLNTTPPDWLLDAADAGELATRADVIAVARELVEDPRAVPVVAAFHADWLQTFQLDTIAKDPVAYPQFGPELVAEMKREVELFTTEVVWLGEGTFDALLYDSVTWTSPALDAIYGTGGARVGSGWERRVLDASRPGVLTRSAFLSAHAYSATSAPVRRGVFVLERMLCEDLTPPPGVSLELDEPTETNTIRDRLAAHAADPACAGCHDKIDPIGFSFEHYGALGEWRDVWDNGIPVDASGVLADPAGAFVGVPEMLSVVDSTDRARDCYAEQWFQYGVGRPAEPVDTCELERIGARFAFTGGDLRDLVVQVAASEALRFRPARVLEDP